MAAARTGSRRRRKQNPFIGTVVRCLTWSVLVLATAVILDRTGPTKGWLRNPQTRSKTKQTSAAPVLTDGGDALPELHLPSVEGIARRTEADATPGELANPPSEERHTRAGVGPSPGIAGQELAPIEKTEYERLYEALVERHLKALSPPKVGRGYRIRLQGGEVVEGTLEEIAPARIMLGLKYGKITLPVHRVIRADLARLFPEQEAKMRALEDVRKTIAARRELEIASTTVPTPPPADPTRVEPPDAPPGAPETRPEEPETFAGTETDAGMLPYRTPPRTGGPIRFNPDPPQSTPDLKPVVVEFARWLEMQHRRMGAKVAGRVFGRRQDGAAVLYLVMDGAFLVQDYDLRFQLAESLWQFWGFRCESKGAVNSLEDAFVVMLDAKGRYIGGSRPTRGSDLWAKDAKALASAQ